MKIIDIDYDKLPKDFFDRVIYYEKLCPSGLFDVDDRFMMILDNGERYYLYRKELRDQNYGRVIPFVKQMMKVLPDSDKTYIDTSNPPVGWFYYYHFHHKCYMKKEVYEKYEKFEEIILEIRRRWDYERMNWWHEQLEKVLEEVYGMQIDQEKIFYIRMNELIEVYSKRYEVKSISLEQFIENSERYLEDSILIYEFLRDGETCEKGYEIYIYFENQQPYWIHGDEAIKIMANIYGEDFVYYPIWNTPGVKKGCWIRKGIYKKYYGTVIAPLEKFKRNIPFYESETSK